MWPNLIKYGEMETNTAPVDNAFMAEWGEVLVYKLTKGGNN